jgi:glucokinase
MNKSHLTPVLAIDLGGTDIKSAILSPDGKIIYFGKYPTQASKGPQKVVAGILSAIKDSLMKAALEVNELCGISIAAAGILDVKNGVVTSSPSLPGWHNIPLRDMVAEKLGMDVCLINDASAAALGEHRFGAGRGADNLVYLTVSTGIGGGIIISGKLYVGADGCAGEIGHMVIEADGPRCNCGNFGCLEVMASGTAIANDAKRRIGQGETSLISEFSGGGLDSITAEVVASAAKQGDSLACEVVDKAAYYLGVGLANIVNIFNPEVVVIGGGVSKMGDILLKPARKVVKQRAFKLPVRTVRIVRSRLGDKAGTIGAAVYLMDR